MVSITPLLFFIFSLNDECDSIRSDFQAGVDTLYNKCKSCGSTPSSKTPTAISNSIQSIYTNRYNAGVSATKKGNATASQVLDGRTFTNSSSVNIEGTMPNRGALNWSSSNTTKSVSAGYYSGGTLDSRPSYNSGRTQGQNDVKNNPNGYGLYNKTQYDQNYTNGYNAGYSAGQSATKSVNVRTFISSHAWQCYAITYINDKQVCRVDSTNPSDDSTITKSNSATVNV